TNIIHSLSLPLKHPLHPTTALFPYTTLFRSSLQEPFFLPPRLINRAEIDAGMDAGRDTFVLNFPPGFQRDLESGQQPAVQLNVEDRKSTRLNSSHVSISYAVFCLKKKIR